MPRYYFNLVDARRLDDEEGQQFRDDAAALGHTVRSARFIMADGAWQGRLPLDEAIEIINEAGAIVAVLAFRDLVTITEHPDPGPGRAEGNDR